MQKLAKMVVDRFNYLADERIDLEDRWLNNFKKYHSYREYSDKEAEDIKLGIKTDIRIPREFSYLETKKPRIINAIFSSRPIMKVNPLDRNSEQAAKNFEIMIQNDFFRYLYEPIFYATDQAMIYGVGVIYLYWVLKNEIGELIDRPGFGFKDVFNFYVPKNYPNIQKAPFIINKLDDTSFADDVDSGRNMISERLDILDIGGGSTDTRKGDLHLDEVEVLECWTPEEIVSVGNRKIFIRHDKNESGFIPFFGIKSYPDPITFYNKGDIDFMMDGPKYATDVKNLRMDILKKIAHPGQLVSRGAQIDPADLIPKPFQIVYTYDMDGYREILRPDIKQSIYNEEAIAEANIENTLGIYSYIKGGYAPRGETARTTIEMKQAAIERLSTMTFFNSIVTFTDLAYKYLIYCKKKMENSRFFRYLDPSGSPEYLEMDADSINGNFEIVPNNVNFRTLQSAEIQNGLVMAYDRLFRSGSVDLYHLNKMLMESFDIKNENTILLKNEEYEVIQFLRQNPDTIPQINALFQQFISTIQNQANKGMINPPMGPGALGGAIPTDLLGGEMGPEAEAILATGGNNPGGLQ